MHKLKYAALTLVLMLASVLWRSDQASAEGAREETGNKPAPEALIRRQTEENPFPHAVGLFYKESSLAAVESFAELVKEHPENRDAALQFAVLLSETARPDKADEVLEVLAKSEPENETLKYERFKTAWLSGNPEKALSLLPLPSETPEGALMEGLLLLEAGRPEEALSFLRLAGELDSYNPHAHYARGLALAELKRLTEAETAFAAALKQEPSLSIATLPLARVKAALGKYQEAYTQFQKARSLLVSEAETVSGEMKKLEEAYPSLVKERSEQKEKKRKVVHPPVVIPPEEKQGGPARPIVRVGLAERLSEVFIKTGGPAALSDRGGASLRLAENTLCSVRREGGLIRISDEGGKLLMQSASGITLAYADRSQTTAVFDLTYEQGYFFANEGDRFYRGSLDFLNRESGITLVNEVSIDEYLYSVVPSEMPSYWPPEALKAQAVAARSYTLANLGAFKDRGFDLTGSVSSAAYRGVGGEAESTTKAVNATRGWVLMDGDRPLSAYYSANTGGYTESTENVWGTPSSLRAVPDLLIEERRSLLTPSELISWIGALPKSYSFIPPHTSRASYRWEIIVPAAEIEARIGRPDIGRIQAISTGRRGVSGRAYEVTVKATDGEVSVQGDTIRSKLGGLKSNLFSVTAKLGRDGLPLYFIFKGAGWGHGVGMCQSGAAGMAKAGYSAEAILSHYYPLSTLKTE
jgi:SpoIID/LytB domain protein